jgi:hypothetical protein
MKMFIIGQQEHTPSTTANEISMRRRYRQVLSGYHKSRAFSGRFFLYNPNSTILLYLEASWNNVPRRGRGENSKIEKVTHTLHTGE